MLPKPVQWEPNCSMWVDRRRERGGDRERERDMIKLIVAFLNFANAPKNGAT